MGISVSDGSRAVDGCSRCRVYGLVMYMNSGLQPYTHEHSFHALFHLHTCCLGTVYLCVNDVQLYAGPEYFPESAYVQCVGMWRWNVAAWPRYLRMRSYDGTIVAVLHAQECGRLARILLVRIVCATSLHDKLLGEHFCW